MANPNSRAMRQALAAKIFTEMLDDVVMDTALRVHKEVRKSQNVDVSTQGLLAMRNESSPVGVSVLPAFNAVAVTDADLDTPSSGAPKQDGNILLDCLNCKRPIASNRYAPHMASCMGLSNGARRGGPRNASKRLDSEGTRSASPQVYPEQERSFALAQNGESSRKRPVSPSDASTREAKRAKMNSAASTPQPRGNVGTLNTGGNGSYTSSVPKTPSKLRSSPVAPQAGESPRIPSADPSSEDEATQSGQQSTGSSSSGTASQASNGSAAVAPSANIVLEGEDRDPDYVDIDGMAETDTSEEEASDGSKGT